MVLSIRLSERREPYDEMGRKWKGTTRPFYIPTDQWAKPKGGEKEREAAREQYRREIRDGEYPMPEGGYPMESKFKLKKEKAAPALTEDHLHRIIIEWCCGIARNAGGMDINVIV